jgi:hypothetical protein
MPAQPIERTGQRLAQSAEKLEDSTERIEDSADRRTQLAAAGAGHAAHPSRDPDRGERIPRPGVDRGLVRHLVRPHRRPINRLNAIPQNAYDRG